MSSSDTETDIETAEHQVLARRWECDLCLECHSGETAWRLDPEGLSCCHVFCKECVKGLVRWGWRCPYDDVELPLQLVCGVMTTAQYVHEVKRRDATEIGGIMCSDPNCAGIAPPAEEEDWPSQVECAQCGLRHCGRRVCGCRWIDGHRCIDLVLRDKRGGGGGVFKTCPTCGVMIEKDGGCNIVYHADCNTSFCFTCRGTGCSHSGCVNSGLAPSAAGRSYSDAQRVAPVARGLPCRLQHKLLLCLPGHWLLPLWLRQLRSGAISCRQELFRRFTCRGTGGPSGPRSRSPFKARP